MPSRPVRPPFRVSQLGIVAALLGAALFAWALANAGLATVLDGIRRLGAGFVLILILAGLRFWARAQAWALATESPIPLGVRDTFPALIAGDTLGNLTPLGVVLSETVKAAFVRSKTTLVAAVAGIAVENLVYIFTVALVIGSGTAALLLLFDTSNAVRLIAQGTLVAIATAVAASALVLTLQIRFVSGAVAWLLHRGGRRSALTHRVATVRELEDIVYGFAGRHPARTMALLGLEFVFHVLGVVEMWVTLAFLAGPAAPTLLGAFVLESVNRTIMVVFKMVPMRLGVDEIGTELLTRTLGLPIGIGVTMAVVRKARMLVWSAAGIAFLVRRGLGPSALAHQAD